MPTIIHQWKRQAKTRAYQAGQSIFREGDPGDEVYIIETGRVAVIKEMRSGPPLVLSYLCPGDMLGEISLLYTGYRVASAQAIMPTTLLSLSRDTFWNLMRHSPEFQQVVMETLIGRLMNQHRHRLASNMWERHLHRRFAALSEEHRQLAELMQMRREMIRFIVHDLRNPLNMVITALSLIGEEPDFEADSELGHLVALALGGVRRMFALTDALIEVGRLQNGEYPVVIELVDMVRLAWEVMERAQPLAQAIGTQLRLENSPDCAGRCLAQADVHFTERVLTHLIDNALNFTPPGGEVTVSVYPEGAWLAINVNDTGPGIPPDQQERIFDRFVQSETIRKTRGFGLGLSYCRSAIRAQGGNIWVEAGKGGVGSCFKVILPIAQAEE